MHSERIPLSLTAALLGLLAIGCGDSPTGDVATSSAAPAHPAAAVQPAGANELVNGGAPRWGKAPPCFPPGARMAVIEGDPSLPGKLWAVRLRFPSGYVIGAHWHPTDENVTVLKGTLLFGFGDHYDPTAVTAYHAGGFVTAPAGVHHYVSTRGQTEVQIHAIGPFAMVFVNDEAVPDCPAP